MEDTEVEINFIKFDNTMNDLKRGDYFITKEDPTRLYLFLTIKCIVDIETGDAFDTKDFEDCGEHEEIRILEKVKITVEK